MRTSIYLVILLISMDLFAQKSKYKSIIQSLEKDSKRYGTIAHNIWEFAEVGYQEQKSSALLQGELKKAGFIVESGVAGMPTAFVASYGNSKPVIGILAEFDALPGISQEAIPERKVIVDQEAGHACGHHLFGTGSTAAGITVKNWLEENGKMGTIRVYGTPAEEGGAGKVYMVRAGLFEDVDIVLHWHPGSSNSASAGSSLANKSAKFRFYGAASHASAAPDKGRSALDGVEAMNVMVNMLREHIPMESRIHYVITRGGEAPNVVPAFAEVYYYVRHPEVEVMKSLFEKVVKTAEGAALGTNTQMEYEIIHGIYNLLPNKTISEVMHKNLELVGGVEYDQEELIFAKKVAESYDTNEEISSSSMKIEPFTVTTRGTGGSTDVGDISWIVPTAGMRTATWVSGTSAHSWQAVAAGGTSIGTKGMMVAAKTIAMTAIDIFQNTGLIDKANKELESRRGSDFKYQALIGNRNPPLDYRK